MLAFTFILSYSSNHLIFTFHSPISLLKEKQWPDTGRLSYENLKCFHFFRVMGNSCEQNFIILTEKVQYCELKAFKNPIKFSYILKKKKEEDLVYSGIITDIMQ